MNGPRKPADWDELYPGRFLKAGQLGDRRPTLTIKDVVLEQLADVDGGEKTKGVISFAEIPYCIALNRTNGICIRDMFGRKIEKWIGRKVTLFAMEWNRKGDLGVRVWGSPELTEDRVVEIKLPRKRPTKMTLHRVERRDASAKPEVERHPTEGQAPAQGPATSAGKDPDGGDRPPF